VVLVRLGGLWRVVMMERKGRVGGEVMHCKRGVMESYSAYRHLIYCRCYPGEKGFGLFPAAYKCQVDSLCIYDYTGQERHFSTTLLYLINQVNSSCMLPSDRTCYITEKQSGLVPRCVSVPTTYQH
jgi:hypothetical protein